MSKISAIQIPNFEAQRMIQLSIKAQTTVFCAHCIVSDYVAGKDDVACAIIFSRWLRQLLDGKQNRCTLIIDLLTVMDTNGHQTFTILLAKTYYTKPRGPN